MEKFVLKAYSSEVFLIDWPKDGKEELIDNGKKILKITVQANFQRSNASFQKNISVSFLQRLNLNQIFAIIDLIYT